MERRGGRARGQARRLGTAQAVREWARRWGGTARASLEEDAEAIAAMAQPGEGGTQAQRLLAACAGAGVALVSGATYEAEQIALAAGWYEGTVERGGEAVRRVEFLDGSALLFGARGAQAEAAPG